MKRTAKHAAFSLLLLMLLAGIATACPTCGDGIGQSDPQGQSLAAGMYYSILFMMSMPYLILATLGCVAYLSIRRAPGSRHRRRGAWVEAPPSVQQDPVTPA